MKAAHGRVFKYGDNVDTDVIIPARYLNSSDPKELATHCMEDIDKDFVNNVKAGDIMVANKNFGCGSSREHAPIAIKSQRAEQRTDAAHAAGGKPVRNLEEIDPHRQQYHTCGHLQKFTDPFFHYVSETSIPWSRDCAVYS